MRLDIGNALRVAPAETRLTVYRRRRVREACSASWYFLVARTFLQVSACILNIAQNLTIEIENSYFCQREYVIAEDWCQFFCNSFVLRSLNLPEEGANFDEKMLNFVKFRKAILGPQKQSPGPKSMKIKQNLPARGPQLAALSGNQEGGCIDLS